MQEIIISLWSLTSGILSGAWNLLSATICWLNSLLLVLHTDYPRLEGLLIGILLAWLLIRRDRHPLLRVLSAPLKLVVDILDLAWDQAVEVVSDVWDTAKGWVVGAYQYCFNKVKGLLDTCLSTLKSSYQWVMGKLRSLKEKLSKKEE